MPLAGWDGRLWRRLEAHGADFDAVTMSPSVARRLAERLHRQDPELLAHVRRVARASPAEAQAVAWLHESLETTGVSEPELLRHGLSGDELRALRLLTRTSADGSDDAYLGHIDLIARAAGRSGQLARWVKAADLEDRRRHPPARRGAWSPPYARGLALLVAQPADSAR